MRNSNILQQHNRKLRFKLRFSSGFEMPQAKLDPLWHALDHQDLGLGFIYL